eukprot:UN32797
MIFPYLETFKFKTPEWAKNPPPSTVTGLRAVLAFESGRQALFEYLRTKDAQGLLQFWENIEFFRITYTDKISELTRILDQSVKKRKDIY